MIDQLTAKTNDESRWWLKCGRRFEYKSISIMTSISPYTRERNDAKHVQRLLRNWQILACHSRMLMPRARRWEPLRVSSRLGSCFILYHQFQLQFYTDETSSRVHARLTNGDDCWREAIVWIIASARVEYLPRIMCELLLVSHAYNHLLMQWLQLCCIAIDTHQAVDP